MEYEDGIKGHQGREFIMYKMIKTNPDRTHDEVNVVRERGNMREGQADQLLKVPEISFRDRILAIKSFGDTVVENTLDKDPDKDKVYEKPKKRDVVIDINSEDGYMYNMMDGNNVVKNQLYEKPERRDVCIDIIDAGMLNTEYEADIIDAVMHDVINVMDENNAAAPTEELQLYYYQYSMSKGWC
jgi:hypothetical protein